MTTLIHRRPRFRSARVVAYEPEIMLALVDLTFYAQPQGMSAMLQRTRRHAQQAMLIRVADELDAMDLMVTEHMFFNMQPLVMRLRARTLGRRGYTRMKALLVENALTTGQHDLTDEVLAVIAKHWRWCPLRYLPVVPLPGWLLRWL